MLTENWHLDNWTLACMQGMRYFYNNISVPPKTLHWQWHGIVVGKSCTSYFNNDCFYAHLKGPKSEGKCMAWHQQQAAAFHQVGKNLVYT